MHCQSEEVLRDVGLRKAATSASSRVGGEYSFRGPDRDWPTARRNKQSSSSRKSSRTADLGHIGVEPLRPVSSRSVAPPMAQRSWSTTIQSGRVMPALPDAQLLRASAASRLTLRGS
jgi:hypothetical protein